jgi:type I restriction enzyme, S subunit
MTVVAIAEVAEQIRGVSYGKADVIDRPAEGFLPVLRANNITDDGLKLDDLVYVRADKVSAKQQVRSGDIVIAASSGSISVVGKAAQAEDDLNMGFGAFCKVVRPSPKVHARYIGHFFKTQDYRRRMSALAAGANINNLKNEHIDEIAIPLPPLEEQKRIAAILDQADELRRKRQRAIDRLNQLGQALFHDMFGDAKTNPMGWKTGQLGDIVRPGDKINYGVVQPGEDVEAGIPLVRVGDLLSGYIDPKKVKQIDTGVEANYKRSRLAGDEILIGCVGSIGTVALAHDGLRGANIARAVARVPVNPEIAMRDFVAEQIKSPAIQNYFTAETRTVAQPTLNIGLIVSAPIILPPMPEQMKFAQKNSAIRDTLVNSLEHAAKEDALFSSLQHRAFQGEL